jgi:hypothetical protein
MTAGRQVVGRYEAGLQLADKHTGSGQQTKERHVASRQAGSGLEGDRRQAVGTIMHKAGRQRGSYILCEKKV